MKIETTEINTTRRQLAIEVPAADVAAAFQDVLRDLRKKISIAGFRPGKAPLEMVRARAGATLGQEAADRLVENFGREAIQREGLEPLPDGVRVKLPEGQKEIAPAAEGTDYAFTLTVDIVPAIDPQGYEGMAITRPPVEVTEEEIEAELKRAQQSQGKLTDVEGRTSQAGDLLGVTMEGAELGQAPVVESKYRVVKLGEAENMPGFNENLSGKAVGEEFAFSVDYPQDYAAEELRGKLVYFKGKIEAIKTLELPPLDDELAKAVGPFETLQDLRERVRAGIQNAKDREADGAAREHMLDQLIAATPFEAPAPLVEEELRERLDELGRSLASQGIDPEKMDIDWDKLVVGERDRADRSVRARIVLDAIARKEGIVVEDAEYDREVARMAQGAKLTIEQAKQRIAQAGNTASLRRDMARGKCLDWLYARAKIS